VTFTVKQQDARDKDLDDWKFEITDDAGKLGVPKIISNGYNLSSKSKETACDDLDDILAWINESMSRYDWPMTRADVKKKVFGEIGGVKNNDRRQADLQAAMNMKYLEESTIKAGNGSYMVQPPEDLPF
jgi:hypothetical protein